MRWLASLLLFSCASIPPAPKEFEEEFQEDLRVWCNGDIVHERSPAVCRELDWCEHYGFKSFKEERETCI